VSVTEICLAVIALSTLAVGAAAAIVAFRIGPLLKQYEELAEAATQTTKELDGLIADVRVMTRDVKNVQSRVTNVASEILNILEPSLNTVSVVVSGLRSGLTSLLGIRGSRRRDNLEGGDSGIGSDVR
jgi:predicted PurR-regulated permease PerM